MQECSSQHPDRSLESPSGKTHSISQILSYSLPHQPNLSKIYEKGKYEEEDEDDTKPIPLITQMTYWNGHSTKILRQVTELDSQAVKSVEQVKFVVIFDTKDQSEELIACNQGMEYIQRDLENETSGVLLFKFLSQEICTTKEASTILWLKGRQVR